MTKPQFFESFRSERDNNALLDVAAGYMARKAVVHLHDRSCDEVSGGATWGGMASRAVLATELVPMAVKIQSLTNGASYPFCALWSLTASCRSATSYLGPAASDAALRNYDKHYAL